MAFDHNMINNYDHLQDTPRAAHHGSKNSEPHHAGGDAGWKMPGDVKGKMKESKGPGGMDM